MSLKDWQQTSTIIQRLETLSYGDAKQGVCFLNKEKEETFIAYHDMYQYVAQGAQQIMKKGVKKGDCVGLITSDPQEFLVSFLAIIYVGAICVPMASREEIGLKNKTYFLESILHIVDDAKISIIYTSESNCSAVGSVLQEGTQCYKTNDIINAIPISNGDVIRSPDSDAEDICFLQYTSGSTSMPKGVKITHRNAIENATAFLGRGGCLDVSDNDKVLGWLPLFHDMGLICLALGPVLVNLSSVIIPTVLFTQSPWYWMESISHYKATITFAPNFAYQLASKLLKPRNFSKMDLSHVRILACGAEPINVDVLHNFLKAYQPVGINENMLLPCYGMAEATVGISFHTPGQPIYIDEIDTMQLSKGVVCPATTSDNKTNMVSCGYVIEKHEIKVIDAHGDSLPDNRVGEICVRGPSISHGYYRIPESSSAEFKSGWLHTGDLGYLSNKRIYITGRKKDILIVNGMNYYPQDVEWAIEKIKGIRPNKATAFTINLDNKEQLVLCVEYKGKLGNDEFITEAKSYVQKNVGIVVSKVVLVSAGQLPLTSSGKVKRSKAKKMFLHNGFETNETNKYTLN